MSKSESEAQSSALYAPWAVTLTRSPAKRRASPHTFTTSNFKLNNVMYVERVFCSVEIQPKYVCARRGSDGDENITTSRHLPALRRSRVEGSGNGRCLQSPSPL